MLKWITKHAMSQCCDGNSGEYGRERRKSVGGSGLQGHCGSGGSEKDHGSGRVSFVGAALQLAAWQPGSLATLGTSHGKAQAAWGCSFPWLVLAVIPVWALARFDGQLLRCRTCTHQTSRLKSLSSFFFSTQHSLSFLCSFRSNSLSSPCLHCWT